MDAGDREDGEIAVLSDADMIGDSEKKQSFTFNRHPRQTQTPSPDTNSGVYISHAMCKLIAVVVL